MKCKTDNFPCFKLCFQVRLKCFDLKVKSNPHYMSRSIAICENNNIDGINN